MSTAKVWVERVMIPTYGIGQPDKNPIFLEKRAYQGSSGKVYPLPVVDKILDEKSEKPYTAVFLENEYLLVMVLPELGGRIQRALDKTNGYDFVYYNRVIKPALVGLTGPWISGGIEFNWPQHHRPTTYAPTDMRTVTHDDGSVSVEMSETDRMYGTKGKLTVRLYPGKAYIEVQGQLYNPTALPQTFLWWANPAVSVNDNTYSVFPPDVFAVYDHGKRAVSTFPIATGVYYKHDYGAGIDISRYRNIPVPTSYMCAHSDYDFVGGYDEGRGAGLLHVADHHVSPGKKQWTWGNGDFGQAWDRNLTDEDGPYIELMTGMYCDNQPDFAWLMPHEEKVFTQYFMPYKAVGHVRNASREIAMTLDLKDGRAEIIVYASARYQGAVITLIGGGEALFSRTADLSPTEVFRASVQVTLPETSLLLTVTDSDGREMLRYAPVARRMEVIPDPQPPLPMPEDVPSEEELLLAGRHLEQYRHATRLPDGYYQEALRRDRGNAAANNALGYLKLRRGLFKEAEEHFRAAIVRLTALNANPQDSDAYVGLGLALSYQEKWDAAYDAFYKAAWSAPQQEAAYYRLACIDTRRGEYEKALWHVERALVRNGHDIKSRGLKGILLKRLGRQDEADAWLRDNLALDAFDYVSRLILHDESTAVSLMGKRTEGFMDCALQFGEYGLPEEALRALKMCPEGNPLRHYHAAYLLRGIAPDRAAESLRKAAACDPAYCFPNRLEDIPSLEYAIAEAPNDPRAPYYLGCLWYDRQQAEKAIALWEQSAQKDAEYPTVWRNLAIAYFNKRKAPEQALECLEKAFRLNGRDARVLLELFQLLCRMNKPLSARLALLEENMAVVLHRDELTVEYITLLNILGRHDQALEMLLNRRFHPWEGGEGRVTTQYVHALTGLAARALRKGEAKEASDLLRRALSFPHNLGEGRLEGATDNDVWYGLGLAERALGHEAEAVHAFSQALRGFQEIGSALYYNDQPAELVRYMGLAYRALGREEQAAACFHRLIAYGEKHYFDCPTPDYFAVSLPDLQPFESNLTENNRAHCDLLIALGSLEMGDITRAKVHLSALRRVDACHQAAMEAALAHDIDWEAL